MRELADRLRTSCGQLGGVARVVVAREVQMHLDLRSPDDAILAEADAILHSQFAENEIKADVQIEKRFAPTWTGNSTSQKGLRCHAMPVTSD
jgi:beta-ureidopropionase / N-carbamoyl-L-amino-acid hydrolase